MDAVDLPPNALFTGRSTGKPGGQKVSQKFKNFKSFSKQGSFEFFTLLFFTLLS